MATSAFGQVCLEHLEQIKKALGFSAVISTTHSWTTHGTQIDLLIDRNDGIINVCEMKYSKGKYALSQEDIERMQNRVNRLQEETGTTKTIFQTLITSYGLTSGSDTHTIHSQLTMDDLFG